MLAAQQDLAFCFFLSVVCDYCVVPVFACALFFLPLLSAATVGEVVSMVLLKGARVSTWYLHLPVWRLVVAPLALAHIFDAAWDVVCWEEARCVVLEKRQIAPRLQRPT